MKSEQASVKVLRRRLGRAAVRSAPVQRRERRDDGEPDRRHQEEWANALSHGVGCLLSVIGAVALMRHVLAHGTPAQILSCLVYGSSLVAVYAASTLSHWARCPAWKHVFRCWDQGLIYLLIAGTYTPIAVAYLEGGWHLITVLMWTLAVAGFVSKVAMHHRVDGIALWLYLGLGWLPIVGLPHLLTVSPDGLLRLCLAGGLAYTLGSVLLMNDHKAPYLHVGWHVLVIVGSALHFLGVWQYTITG